MNPRDSQSKWVMILALLVVAFVAGCGEDRSPARSDENTVSNAPDDRTWLVFSPEVLARAGKESVLDKVILLPEEGLTTSTLMGPTGGMLALTVTNTHGPKNDIKVAFSVPEGALNAPVEISMQVSGSCLEDLVIAFAPGGLEFLVDAELDIRVGKDLVGNKIERIKVLHVYADGKVEDAELYLASDSGKAFRFVVAIPGFSRYSMAGGNR